MKGKRMVAGVLALGLLLVMVAGMSVAQGTAPQESAAPGAQVGSAFTYQGKLDRDGSPYTGTCDFQFSLYDALDGDNQIGNIQTITGVSVVAGLFTVTLNSGSEFGGSAFNGEARWLRIDVKCDGDGSYTAVPPRQPLTPAPYALALPGLWTQENATSPNLVGGYHGNAVGAGVVGAVIAGGGWSAAPNQVVANFGAVSGGSGNVTTGEYATVSGGKDNRAEKDRATVGGGLENIASGYTTVIGGGYHNRASGLGATIAGGEHISVTGRLAAAGGGFENTVEGAYATVGGGWRNVATGPGSTVAGGNLNHADGITATVSGGYDNAAGGQFATVIGGAHNTADGEASLAAGYRARADKAGCFVWGDDTEADIACQAENEWVVRTSGGVAFFTSQDLSTGVYVIAGDGSWNSVTNRALRENAAAVDGREVLARVATLPVSTWTYQAEGGAVRHMGPMAQDFYAAFHLGDSERSINTLDADGVALAAVQGLYQVVHEQQSEIAALNGRVAELEARLARQGERQPVAAWPLAVGLAAAGAVAWQRRGRGGRP